MARTDLLTNLIKAGSEKNFDLFIQIAQSIIKEEEFKQHHTLAERLKKALNVTETKKFEFLENQTGVNSDFFTVIKPEIELAELILSNINLQIVSDFLEEYSMKDYLRSNGINPRNKILLVGKPGNGKTSLAEAMAYELAVPLYHVNYEVLINSLLGESLSRIKKLFSSIYNSNCVLFFDEFDTVSKSRGDKNEVGEVKRIVNLLLTNIDKLSSNTILIAATNHPEALDHAMTRRFQITLELDAPSELEITKYLESYSKRFDIDFLYQFSYLSRMLNNFSFSDLKEFCDSVRRSYFIKLNKNQSLSKKDIKAFIDIIKQSKNFVKAKF
jgi:AAA+ superfamily predicted ATPase